MQIDPRYVMACFWILIAVVLISYSIAIGMWRRIK